jgi:hypothetical protein
MQARGLGINLTTSALETLMEARTVNNLWVANWQIWHESPLWCSLVQIGRQDSFQVMRDSSANLPPELDALARACSI